MMYDVICYEKPFLKEVIARIDFVAHLPAIDKALSPKLATLLSKQFPVSEPVDALVSKLAVQALSAH
jgi:hypothetical protein